MTVIQCGFDFFELIKTVMAINSLARHFFGITDVGFFEIKRRHARSVVPFAQICAFALLVSTVLGLRAWGDDFNVVQFKFLEDDTKLAQSCTDWLHVQHWYTVVPDPAMRVTLWALMGVGDDCDKRTQDTASLFPCSRVVLISATIASVQADSAVPGVLFPRSCPYLCCASCNCITRRPLLQGQACVDAPRRLAL